MIIANTTTEAPMLSGYDLPLLGIEGSSDWQFYVIHITALVCITISFVCAVYVIIASFRNKDGGPCHNKRVSFFRWNKSQRLVVYLSFCDLMFNVSHLMDHSQMVIAKDHVRPKSVCAFYASIIIIFVSSQNLMVHIISVNLFCLIYKGKNMSFGTWDWKLLTYVFGVPVIIVIVSIALDQLGPMGATCYFDGVKGTWSIILLSTVPITFVFVCNSILYSLTWFKIYLGTRATKAAIGNSSHLTKTNLRSARSLSMFVIAFFIQWTPMVVYGITQLFKQPGFALTECVVTFCNLGGLLNAIVYKLLTKQRNQKAPSLQKGNENICVVNNHDNSESKNNTDDSKSMSVYSVDGSNTKI